DLFRTALLLAQSSFDRVEFLQLRKEVLSWLFIRDKRLFKIPPCMGHTVQLCNVRSATNRSMIVHPITVGLEIATKAGQQPKRTFFTSPRLIIVVYQLQRWTVIGPEVTGLCSSFCFTIEYRKRRFICLDIARS